MPIALPPIARREFIKGSLALGGSAMIAARRLDAAEIITPKLDQSRVALLADTHISANPNLVYPGTKWPGSPVSEDEHEGVNMAQSLTKVVEDVIALNPRPANLIINGDCTHSRGTEAEYRELIKILEPIRLVGITVHVTIGNHDNRNNLWSLLPFLKKEQLGIQASVIELPHANFILLDSGKRGSLGESQLNWLAKQLDTRAYKPALVFGHYNPFPNRGIRPIRGMSDGQSLLKILTKRKHARAYLYGHTHEWQHHQKEQLHLVNQPAVSYYFGKGHAHGWLDMKLTKAFADLKLQCKDRAHQQHGDRRKIILKD